MIQDAVLLSLKELSGISLPNISEAYVLDEHLKKRGFITQSLRLPFKLATLDEIVKLIMDDETHIIGSF